VICNHRVTGATLVRHLPWDKPLTQPRLFGSQWCLHTACTFLGLYLHFSSCSLNRKPRPQESGLNALVLKFAQPLGEIRFSSREWRMITNHSEDFFGKKLAKFCPKYSDRCECVPNSLNSRSVSPESIGKVGKARAEAEGGRWSGGYRQKARPGEALRAQRAAAGFIIRRDKM
jgi:hypothetical protein